MTYPKWFKVRRNRNYGGIREFPAFGSLQYGEHAVLLSEGGWAQKWMTTKELRAARERWIKVSCGGLLSKARTEYGGVIQCGGCRFFGAFDADFGLCCNPASSFDGKVTFEHGGCIHHSNIEDGTVILDGDDIRWP